jgi:hypothetical protein
VWAKGKAPGMVVRAVSPAPEHRRGVTGTLPGSPAEGGGGRGGGQAAAAGHRPLPCPLRRLRLCLGQRPSGRTAAVGAPSALGGRGLGCGRPTPLPTRSADGDRACAPRGALAASARHGAAGRRGRGRGRQRPGSGGAGFAAAHARVTGAPPPPPPQPAPRRAGARHMQMPSATRRSAPRVTVLSSPQKSPRPPRRVDPRHRPIVFGSL